jgi:uncharacterized protein with HEPN domain
VSRSWLLYLDDLIASAEKIGRLVSGRTLETFAADEAVFDAILFNPQVIGEAVKRLPEEARAAMPEAIGSGPARLRDLIAHRYFALDPEIIWEVATLHVPRLLSEARNLQDAVDTGDAGV